MTKKKPVRTHFKEHIEQDRLDDRQYRKMHELVKSYDGASSNSRSPFSQWRSAAAVAAALLLFFTSYYLFTLQSTPGTDNPVVASLADEVATNHIKIREMDIETSSIDQVRQHLDRLDFTPVLSASLPVNGLSLQGGRYCTLQGRIAAQITLATVGGEKVTYYQAAYDPQKFGPLPDIDKQEDPVLVEHRGVEIRIWVEQGIVMARAVTAR